ncbi:MAG: tRNA adenosine(34) deaminase TadA [Thermodesulfobacteriota bacterium]|nr:tRNA adenosine(34) deaminase TadA [Thermodesulfobacteriota bacterium]
MTEPTLTHEAFMEEAILEAKKAAAKGEVPVGAVLVSGQGMVVAKAHNQTIALSDPTAHAEVLALRSAGETLRNYRLVNTILYVTMEPCIMCMGALLHARIATLVFGAKDPKWGAAGSLYDLSSDPRLNHRIDVQGGILERACRELIQAFFKEKRLVSRSKSPF